MTASDRRLLQRSAAGDRQAFEDFVERHQSAVYRYLRSTAGDPSDAEDALQEAFLAAWRGASSFRGPSSARPWLLAIARNALRRQHRRRREEVADVATLEALGRQAGWGRAETLETRVARTLDRDLVRRSLMRLPARDREILILRELEGLSGPEAARVLGLGLAAAKSRLHRARLRLTAAIREEE